MKNYLKINIILFCIYMLSYILIDYYIIKQSIQWGYNLILAIIFSLIISKLITK